MRSRYNDFLSQDFSEKEIFILSSDVDRTIMSAAANMAGLYTPSKSQVWNTNLLWQPIPIRTVPADIDVILNPLKPCPAYKYYAKRLFETEEFKLLHEKHQKLFNYISKESGETIKDIWDVQNIYDTLIVQDLFNKT